MADVKIRVMQGDQPVVGAEVIAGEVGSGKTNAQGRVTIGAQGKPAPMALHILITAEDNSFAWGGGPIRVVPGEETVIEV